MNTQVELLNEKEKREINNCYILGRLADDFDYDYIPPLGVERKSVTKSHKNENTNVFYLQSLSEEPKAFSQRLGKDEKECYVSFDDRNGRYLQSIKYFEQTDKIKFLREHLEGKLILFKPKLNVRNGGDIPYHYNFEIVFVFDDKFEANHYIAVPQVKKGMPAVRFEKALMERTPIQLSDYPTSMEIPEFILCDGYLYYIPMQDILETSHQNSITYYAKRPKDILKLPINELSNFWDQLKATYREIGFISDLYASSLRDTFNLVGKPITDQEQPIKKEEKIQTNSQALEQKVEQELTEVDFIARLKYFAQKEDLVYREEEALVNFHTALKTCDIAVLGGMSGTGKTQLALQYARALGLKEGENLLVVPISPSYTEPADILGYLNHQMGLFMESETGLVSFLERASGEPDELFMVLFDEMNLGQVEHYFSPFISLLEMPREQRMLRLFSKDAVCHNRKFKKGIPIRDNVLFVGTANFDETTKDFSNRMLDRMNVIFLEKLSFGEAFFEKESSYNEVQRGNKDITRKLYRETWKSKGFHLEETEVALLDRLHEDLRGVDAQIGVSFRVAKGIGNYIENIPEDQDGNPFITRKTAFDYQIKQRILTKIRGHREQIQELVGTFEGGVYQQGLIARRLLEERSGEDEFKSSLDFLEQKAKELTRNGYAL
ncbi:McrB family protein [Paenibacillus sp. UNC499MF]|uniref:McrB family protein n=1 Tax=Paenibacillus sp. UNC499MF TaxID=1502751 RepID=UPI0008A013BC|nr:AAA family ATPase [Paenibacillus sp. UNC499MF]SEG75557.1 AAA domain (dynein-related subfamily) [Paenibacillus sp. UNC499MF]